MHKNRLAFVFASLASLLALGCKDDARKAAPSSAPMVGEAAPIKEAAPGSLAFLAPPLGAPDAIAPPTLELVPGMRTADATAKGAKPQRNGNDWTWRPQADLKVDEDHGVIAQIVGIYTPAEIAALTQKWGKPTFGDSYWMGASWLAEVGSNCGDAPPCFVYFTRAPNQQFFGKSPVPPLGLARLAFDMPRADVAKLFGFEPSAFTETGYSYKVSYDFVDDKLRSLTVSRSSFIEQDQEIAHLTSLWGAPAKHGDDDALIWIDPAARWAAIHEVGQLSYYPIVLWSDLLAKDGAYSIVAASAKLLGKNETEVGAGARAWPGTEADPTETTVVEPYADDDVVTSVAISINLPEDAVGKHVALIEKALGKAVKSKTEDGDEQAVIHTGGLAIQLLEQAWGIELTVTKPAS